MMINFLKTEINEIKDFIAENIETEGIYEVVIDKEKNEIYISFYFVTIEGWHEKITKVLTTNKENINGDNEASFVLPKEIFEKIFNFNDEVLKIHITNDKINVTITQYPLKTYEVYFPQPPSSNPSTS